MKSRALYYVSAFLCGAVVMGVELSASRLLAPYFGNSLYVWTNVIAVVLLALAAGYAYGGKLADKKPDPRLYFFLIWGTGLWILLIPFFAAPLSIFLLHISSNLSLAVRMGSLVVMAILFLIPMFVLGMIVPFTLKLKAHGLADLAATSGKLSMVSTLGSLLGTFLPTFVLIPLLGTTKTFLFLGFVLLFLAAYGLRKPLLFLSTFVLLTSFFFVPSVYADASIIAAQDSPYGFIFVTEDEAGLRRLHIDSPLGTQSLYDPNSPILSEAYYYNYFAALPALMEAPESVLILGHAGGSFTRLFNAYYPELEITGVELDPAVTEISKQYMGLDEATVSIVTADARAYLLSTEEKYDLILVDTYHGTSIPAHLATQEFFNLCAEHLKPDGILALNAASSESPFLNVLQNTMASRFGTVFTASIPKSFNAMLLTRASGVYEPVQTLETALAEKWELLLQGDPQIQAYDESATVFVDDRLSEVEILNEEMFMRLLEAF